jgi:glyoxylase-like metal-dependent hydrolase (beta-lactamase superfamily II)
LIVGEKSVGLVDPTTQEGANEICAETAQLFGKPLRYIIATHKHSDHTPGLAVFDGEPLTVFCSEECLDELAPSSGPALYIGVRDTARLTIDGIQVRLFTTRGTGHTPWDMLVHFPDEHILCSGDLIVPFSRLNFHYANPEHWVRELREIAERRELYDTILPGHGDPLPSSHIIALADYLTFLLGEAKKCVDGHFPEGIVDDISRSELDKIVTDYFAAGSPESIKVKDASKMRAEHAIRMVTRFLYYRKLM